MAAAAPAAATNELFSRQGRPVAFNVAPQGACMYPSPALALTDVSNQTSPSVWKWDHDLLLAFSRKSLQRQLQPRAGFRRRY